MTLVWTTLKEQGYDPDRPKKIEIWTPPSVESVNNMMLVNESASEDDVRVLLMALLGVLGFCLHVVY